MAKIDPEMTDDEIAETGGMLTRALRRQQVPPTAWGYEGDDRRRLLPQIESHLPGRHTEASMVRLRQYLGAPQGDLPIGGPILETATRSSCFSIIGSSGRR